MDDYSYESYTYESEDRIECPICMDYSGDMRSDFCKRCKGKEICTLCYIKIRDAREERRQCPFCNGPLVIIKKLEPDVPLTISIQEPRYPVSSNNSVTVEDIRGDVQELVQEYADKYVLDNNITIREGGSTDRFLDQYIQSLLGRRLSTQDYIQYWNIPDDISSRHLHHLRKYIVDSLVARNQTSSLSFFQILDLMFARDNLSILYEFAIKRAVERELRREQEWRDQIMNRMMARDHHEEYMRQIRRQTELVPRDKSCCIIS